MRAKSKTSDARNANFVFKGTIKKLKATTMTAATVTDRTCIVTVNQIIEAPQNLAAYTGQDITVQLHGRRKVSAGDRMIFHAISWLFGESLAVRSLYEEIEANTRTREVDPVTRRKQRETNKHFNDADVVVSGKVVEVRLPLPGSGPKQKAAKTKGTTHVSEHDPKWREAVIEVAEVHKGSPSKRQLVIRFPASKDVAWRRAPKLEAGQEGYFMLHASAKGASGRATKKGNEASATYIVKDPQDYQPYTETGGIKSIIESESGS
jgi:hypothetical protein